MINEIDNNPKICKYIDIPLQHIHDEILQKMKRRGTYQQICDLIDKIKNCKNKISIRSSFIVGFPYETEESQELLKEFLLKYKLDNVGFFTYSREEGTLSYSYPNQVPERIKKQRQKELYALQKEIVSINNQNKIGLQLEAVCEEYNETKNLYTFRSQYDSPGVDTVIFVKTKLRLELGNYYNLKITGFKGYDLLAENVNKGE